MNEIQPTSSMRVQRIRLPYHLRELLQKLLFQTHRGSTRQDFLRQAAEILLAFSGCDLLELRLVEDGKSHRCKAWLGSDGQVIFESQFPAALPAGNHPVAVAEGPAIEGILEDILAGRFAAAAPFVTRSGSFWTGDTARPILLHTPAGAPGGTQTLVIGGRYQSLALIPFPVAERATGVLRLSSLRRESFSKEDVSSFEIVAVTLGVAIAHQEAQWALRERVKELTCLYGIARATQQHDKPADQLLRDVVELLPPGWQYPEITAARITLGGRTYATVGYDDSPWRQSAEIVVNGEKCGTVEVVYSESRPALDEGPFLKEERNLINAVAETIGVTLSYQTAQTALRERVKELTCLYAIAKAAQRPDIPLVDLLQQILPILPPSLLHPEAAGARIQLDDEEYASRDFREAVARLSSSIVVCGATRGVVEGAYFQDMPEIDEGPFLKEERLMLNEVARQVGLIIERREAEDENARLQQQLRHADRLATIGQLAAGTAHELNEPLGSILGFAELTKSLPRLPRQAQADLGKIIDSALHAREVIRKLLIFAHQMPTQKAPIRMNDLVEKCLVFLESRCAREGIEVVRRLRNDLPEINGDASQLHQVLVNLVVNAIQAMPAGGTLTVSTRRDDPDVILTVEDTGSGMDDQVLRQIFIPFFTTKQVGQGTGLGLSVVHGIVTSHGGTVQVRSQIGHGSCFEVRLPTGQVPDTHAEHR